MSHERPEYNNIAPALRAVAMPMNTNANGDIFGGWLLSQMDLAGSVVAVQKAKANVATVGIEAMSFKKPVSVGDEVSFYASVKRIGRTSITVHIEAWARPRLSELAEKVTEGLFTYVALDADKKPLLIMRESSPEGV